MSLAKQPVLINFSKGLDLKTDPYQVQLGNFLRLENSIFDKGGRLTKRNGYSPLTSLIESATFITTFEGNLTAIGSSLQAYGAGSNQWFDKGTIQPLSLSTLSLIRSNNNQTQLDVAVSSNNYVCTVYTDVGPGNTVEYKYAMADSITGQNILPPAVIPSSGAITTAPRVFTLGFYFVILFSTSSNLEYVAVNTSNPVIPTASTTLSTQNSPSTKLNYDGAVANGNLYIAWNGSDGGGAIRTTWLDSLLNQHTTQVTTGHSATLMSVSVDTSIPTPNVYVSWWTSSGNNGFTEVLTNLLSVVTSPTQIITSQVIENLTAVAANNVQTVFYEVLNTYGYDSTIQTDYVESVTMTVSGTMANRHIVDRGIGLASKAFILNSIPYFMAVYDSPFQPTYFLINASGEVMSRLAYSNGGGYKITGLPGVNISGQQVTIGYQYADLIQAVNKNQGEANPEGVYTQTGLNAVTFTFGTTPVVSEIGQTLNLTGGFLWMYDGYTPVEQNFFLWPDDIEATTTNTLGALDNTQYFYQVVYQWSDNQGNIYNSAPSIPLSVDLTAAGSVNNLTATFASGSVTITATSSTAGVVVGQVYTDSTTPGNFAAGTYVVSIVGSTITLSQPTLGASASSPGDTLTTTSANTVVLNIPTLRLTYKTANPVKIVIFRWSAQQQNYFEITSITNPLLNDSTTDYVTYTDIQADTFILGNALIYTTGGVVEDIGAPSFNTLSLFDDRLWGIDAEDPNLLWYSKQVIENTPVEMSDLFTLFVAPTISVQGSTGFLKCLAPMDDKLILFKPDALYYINGSGPDNTGANSQYSQPTFIAGTVGCSNQQSIVFIPNGLMFQSGKGIWLLDRNLNTQYIGAPVEDVTLVSQVISSVSIPETNQVRFNMDNGTTLMYDYFYQQWGTFTTGIPAVSSCIYKGLHTYLTSGELVLQESSGQYLDNGNPVLQAFTTNWIKGSGNDIGYQRLYFMFLLGTYKSPHTLNIGVAYDYNSNPSQNVQVLPDNYSAPWGTSSPWGGDSTWGGSTDVEQARVFFEQGKCRAFQIQVDEIFDPSFGTQAGAGLTLSGINLVVGVKKPYPTISAGKSFG